MHDKAAFMAAFGLYQAKSTPIIKSCGFAGKAEIMSKFCCFLTFFSRFFVARCSEMGYNL